MRSGLVISNIRGKKISGYILRTIRSGRRILEDIIPMLDLAIPYEAPKQVKTMAAAQPIAPKNDWGID